MDKKNYFITGNPQKLKEFSKIIGDLEDIEIDIKNIDLPEYQGESEKIARKKCLVASEIVKTPVLVEDTSLIPNITTTTITKTTLSNRTTTTFASTSSSRNNLTASFSPVVVNMSNSFLSPSRPLIVRRAIISIVLVIVVVVTFGIVTSIVDRYADVGRIVCGLEEVVMVCLCRCSPKNK